MSSVHIGALAPERTGVPSRLIVALAAGAGFSVASIYYSQPMLGVIAAGLGSDAQATGMVPTLTQLGYALGILLLAPLGDRVDRRRLILFKSLLLAAALVGAAVSGGLPSLLLASLLVGLMATVAQDVVPTAAMLAPEHQRGAVVGKVMTGLLLGILLSRVASGLVAQALGWRAMFGFAAASVVVMALALARELPHLAPTTSLGYPALLRSLVHLWRGQPQLRRAMLAQGLLAVGFSAFWSTLAVMLHTRYQLG
uniref:MFS transporter n=1 Tax=uncultured Stenotrophomonas sp. TaxID=165438 RepID=UPI0028D50F42